jgi:dolichyl-phosphate-mannose--protein O-mannosyl transferase
MYIIFSFLEKIIQHLLMSNKMVASIVIGGTVVVFGVPLGIKWLGFTVAGVAAKSIAAWLMSILGPIGAGSLYANLQSIGVLGLSYAAKVLLFLLGGTIGGSLSSIFGLTYIFFKNCVLEVDPDI